MESLQKIKLKFSFPVANKENKKSVLSLRHLSLLLGGKNTEKREIKLAVEKLMNIKEKKSLYLDPLFKALLLRNRATAEHSLRVALYSLLIADTLGMEKDLVENICIGALFHDIGKIGIPDTILLKKGKIDTLEREVIKYHPIYSYEILGNLPLPIVKNILLKHHERIDGKGYPLGVNYTEIPLYVNLISVCDVFDALTERRPYKEPKTLEEALAILENEAGKAFYPEVVEVATFIFSKVGKIDLQKIEFAYGGRNRW